MTDADHRARLAYDESVRALDMKNATLAELRTRTGILLTAVSLSSAFLGATALKHHHVLYWASIGGLACFVATVAFALGVIVPREDWEFVYGARTILGMESDAPKMYSHLAEGNDDSWKANRGMLDARFGLFRLAALTLGSSLAFWLLDVGIR